MKRKIFSVLLALVLALSLSLVTAVPAMANPGTLNVIPIPMELNMAGGLSEWSIAMSHTGSNSIHLKTTSSTAGAEARAVIMASSVGVDTLADIDSVSWWEYLVQGYPPHIDIGLDIDGNGSPDDWLVIEYAYNTSEGDVRPEGQPDYGAETGAWYQTFNDDGNGPVAIDDNAYAWLTSQTAGPVGGEFGADGHYGTTLADWKAGQTVPGVGEISASTVVTHFVIEVDNWRTPLVQADVYVDDVAFNVNGMAYFGSIQYAIDSAQPNDTISVAAGTYTEDLVIPDTKANLELVGATGATIKGVQNVPIASWPLGVPNIEILADGVKIHGFTIQGPDYEAAYYASGIILDGTDIEIYDNDFVTTAAETEDELAHAITTISKAVLGTADVSGLNIHDNTFTGSGAIGSEFIYINPHTGSGTITIDANQFSGSVYVGITAESGEVSCTNNTIDNETVGSGLYGIRFMDTTYLANYGNILVSGNTIQNTVRAIRVGNGGAGASVFTAVISNNTLTDNTIGIWGRLGNNITATNNTIVGNTVGVQNDDATVTINAEYNWWGDASGPTHTSNPSGTGDEVTDNVDFDPWLYPPTVVTAAASSLSTTSATLNGSLDDLGNALSVDVSFEWGFTTAYGNETTTQEMTSTGTFTASLTGLSSNTTYHFIVKAVGHGPDAYGDDITFTTRAEPVVVVPPPAPPAGTTDVRGDVDPAGVFLEPVTAISEDELCTLDIPEGTVGLTEELEPLDEITMVIMDEPPAPPEDAHVVGLAYDFGPDGATFDPPITLTWSYDPETLPEGVAEKDLVLAYYDEATGEWVVLEGCVIDTENNTITASIAHFTTFAIIGVVPVVVPLAPAVFIVSSLGISPSEVAPSEEVNTSVLVANTGGESGSYTVVLKIDGVKEAEERVTVAAGGSQTVTFSVTKEEAGSYTITVDGLSSSFAVVPVVVPPELAAFSVSYLSVSPRLEVEPGETVTITVMVANTGGESGSYTVVLKIDGVKEAEETVTVAAGDSQDVSFSVTKEEAGSYTVTVDGLSGSFTVVLPIKPPGVNWPAVGGGIAAGVIVIGLLIFFFLRRRAA